ncbi:MAG: methyltransferase domain-containing protein, partial [Bacteroidota bacterium]
FQSIHGTAENTSLEADHYSHIIAGQAFHWFDPVLAKKEFQRILSPGGWVVLIWNERDTRSPFLNDYEAFLNIHAVNYAEVVHRNMDEKVFTAFYEPFSYEIKCLSNDQLFDFEGMLGRYQSSSYAYQEGDASFPQAKEALMRLFDKHAQDGTIKMEYQTNMYYGQLK